MFHHELVLFPCRVTLSGNYIYFKLLDDLTHMHGKCCNSLYVAIYINLNELKVDVCVTLCVVKIDLNVRETRRY